MNSKAPKRKKETAQDRYEAKRRTDPVLRARRRETNHKGWISRRYGLSLLDFELILKEQCNKCAICAKEFEGRPHVDHCHTSTKVRGLLCKHCNLALGHFEDDLVRLVR